MTTSRRDFLLRVGTVPLAFGVPLGGCLGPDAPAWLPAALASLRSEDRPGLLFRLPPGKEQRCALGHSLTRRLLNSKDPDVREVLAEAVLLCLEDSVVEDRFRGARRGDTLLLVDGDGFAADGCVFEPGDHWENFVPAARALLHGPGGRRLAGRAGRAKARASKETLALLARPEPDVVSIAPKAAGLIPILVEERLQAAEPRREALRKVLEAHGESISPALPYGVETTAQMKGGCGDCGCEEAPKRNLMVACGMAAMVKNARYFVKFLSRP